MILGLMLEMILHLNIIWLSYLWCRHLPFRFRFHDHGCDCKHDHRRDQDLHLTTLDDLASTRDVHFQHHYVLIYDFSDLVSARWWLRFDFYSSFKNLRFFMLQRLFEAGYNFVWQKSSDRPDMAPIELFFAGVKREYRKVLDRLKVQLRWSQLSFYDKT